MKWSALATVVLVASAAGGTVARATASGPRVTGEVPPEALLVAGKRDTILIGLDGRVHGRIPGVKPAWMAVGQRNEAFQQLASVLVDRAFVVDRTGRWYALGTSGDIRALPKPQIRLADGAVVTAQRTTATVVHHGLVVFGVRRISGSLAIAQSAAVDLDTGVRWKLSDDCYAVGLVQTRLLEFCGPSGDNGSVALVAVSKTGPRTILSNLPDGLYAGGASISPDGKYVVGMFSPGCGGSYAFVVPTSGGPARALSGEADWTVDAPNSFVLGWTTDNRVVARVQPSRTIDVDPKPGIYVIDPQTLKRTLIYPSIKPWALWTATDR